MKNVKHVVFMSLPTARHTTLETRVNKVNGRKAIYRTYDDGFQVVVRYSRGLYKGRDRVSNYEEAHTIMNAWLEGKA